jgi:hypothetical protein
MEILFLVTVLVEEGSISKGNAENFSLNFLDEITLSQQAAEVTTTKNVYAYP